MWKYWLFLFRNILNLSMQSIKSINLSIKSTFPDECRIAKLKPKSKKGARTHPKNYRRVSLLSLVSKIIEQAIVQTIIKSFVLSNSNHKLNGMFFTVITIDITIICSKCSIYIYITQASVTSLVGYFSFPRQFLGTFKSLESISYSQ